MSAPITSSSEIGVTFTALLAYHEAEAARWRAWFDTQPSEVLDLPFGDADRGMGTFGRETLDELFASGEQAQTELRAYLAGSTDAEMTEPVSISGQGVTITGTRRKFLTHFFVHSLRHWAQLSTVLRQHGYQTDWQHDLVLSDTME